MQVTTLIPGIRVLRAGNRLRTETSWLDSWHCFSYGRHYEPDNTHHGLLVACNDDTIRGSTGFAEHAHQEMEIVTWMVEGELEHRDCAGGGTHVLRPGMVRRISAGRGIRHSEMNPAGWAPTRYIEMWVPPDREGIEPAVELADVETALAGGGLVPVASGAGHARGAGGVPLTPAAGAAPDSAVFLHQARAVLWAARLAPGEHVILPDAPHVHLFVVIGGGVLDTGGLAGAGPLEEGDSVRLTAAGSPVFTAPPSGVAEILVWETG
jgi:redox-sensitive bicupin YhaK (pirin superfamily)